MKLSEKFLKIQTLYNYVLSCLTEPWVSLLLVPGRPITQDGKWAQGTRGCDLASPGLLARTALGVTILGSGVHSQKLEYKY